MEPDPTVLASLRKAVEAMPDDVPLRVHLATLLLQAGQRDEAIRHVGAVLQRDPGNTEALALLQRPAAPAPSPSPSAPQVPPAPQAPPAGPDSATAGPVPPNSPVPPNGPPPAGPPAPEAGLAGPRRQDRSPDFDWSQAESELSDVLPPMFVGSEETSADSASAPAEAFDAEHTTLKLADVAGMNQVKQRDRKSVV